MTDQQARLVKLASQYEDLKRQMKDLKPQLEQILLELGIGTHFQDPNTGAVYQVDVPTGTFISFDRITYNRTRMGEEKTGSLALKKAEELGYKVK